MTDFSLNTLAEEWNKMLPELIEQKKTTPINPYQPTKKYQNKLNKSEHIKLNIGAGPNIFPHSGWINIDKYDFTQYFNFLQTVDNSNGMPEQQRVLWQWCQDGNEIDYQTHDCTTPFTQFKDNSVDFIYGGQMIEHLNPIYQTPNFLKECHRMLKPGGILRLTTPDLDILIRAYTSYAPNINTMEQFYDDQPEFFRTADPASQLAFLMFGAAGPDCNQQNYQGHFFIFNQISMKRFLTEAGFKDIETTWSKCGKNKQIAMEIHDEGLSHSLIVEAVK